MISGRHSRLSLTDNKQVIDKPEDRSDTRMKILVRKQNAFLILTDLAEKVYFSFKRTSSQSSSREHLEMCDIPSENFINSVKIAIKKLQRSTRQLEKLSTELERFGSRKGILFPATAMDAMTAGCTMGFAGLAGSGSLLYAALMANGDKHFVAKPETKYRLGKIEAAINDYVKEINGVEGMYNQLKSFEKDRNDVKREAVMNLQLNRNIEVENLVLKIAKGELTNSTIREARFKLLWQQRSLEELCISF